MRKIKVGIAFLVALTILMAGCLGGGEEDGGTKTEYVEARGTIATEGSREIENSPDPVPVQEVVALAIPEQNITVITIDIKVMDDDDGTNADEASGSLDDAGGGYNVTLKNSVTPYSDSQTLRAPEGFSLPSQWTLTLNVVCNPGDDRWPGPLYIIYTPDNGFSYNVTLKYVYLTPAET